MCITSMVALFFPEKSPILIKSDQLLNNNNNKTMDCPQGHKSQRRRESKKGLARKFLDFFQLTPEEKSRIPDHLHPHRRRFLAPYRQRLRYVRDFWLYYLTAILLLQITLPFLVISLLFSTLISFAFLEETVFPD